MSSSPGIIELQSTNTRKIVVDNRIPLRNYYQIADNILRQAAIFREEKNIVDLYITLLRFSSLVAETIPYHQDYRTHQQREKISMQKKLLRALTELEDLKPAVEKKIADLSKKKLLQSSNSLGEPSHVSQQTSINNYTYTNNEGPDVNTHGHVYPDTCMLSSANPLEEQTSQLTHRQREKISLRALIELEDLKPAVEQKIAEVSKKKMSHSLKSPAEPCFVSQQTSTNNYTCTNNEIIWWFIEQLHWHLASKIVIRLYKFLVGHTINVQTEWVHTHPHWKQAVDKITWFLGEQDD